MSTMYGRSTSNHLKLAALSTLAAIRLAYNKSLILIEDRLMLIIA